jgi:hypothetical protein
MSVLDIKGITRNNQNLKLVIILPNCYFIFFAHAENSFGFNRDVVMSYIEVGCFRIWLLLHFYKVSGKAMLLINFRRERVD